MTNEKSAMHERFQQISEQVDKPVEPTTGTWFELTLIELLKRPVTQGRAVEELAQKEYEIRVLFEGLAVIDAWHLHRRLTVKQAGDELVVAFARFIPERRARLIAFLGDARRRAALARCA